jgi:hypothetical protein
MKLYDHIRYSANDLNEAVGEALRIFNNRRNKDNTVEYVDMQIIAVGMYTVIIILTYEPETRKYIGQLGPDDPPMPTPSARRYIGMPIDADPAKPDHSDD